MKLLSNAGRKAKSGARRLFSTILNQWDRSGDLFTTKKQGELIKQYKGWVYACVNKNANGVAAPAMDLALYQRVPESGGPKTGGRIVKAGNGRSRYVNDTTYRAYRENKGIAGYLKKGMEIEEIAEHPFLDLMEAVNPHKNKWDLLFGTVLSLQLAGDAYWWLVPSSLPSASLPGRTIPAELWLLPTQWITPIKDPANFISGYRMKIGAAEEIFAADEIVHFSNVNPNDLWRGMSPLEAAAASVLIDEQKKRYTFNFFKNWAVPPVAFKLPYDKATGTGVSWDGPKWKKFKREWKRIHGGPDNAGGMALLQGGLELENIGFSPKEFFYLLQEKPSIEELAAVFGVPIYKLTGEGADRRNADQDDYSWLKDTVTPILKNLEQKINEQIMPIYDPNIFMAFPDIIPTDRKQLLEENKALIHLAKTVNEVREEMGKDPMDGGDVLYRPNALTEINAPTLGPEGEQAPTPEPGPPPGGDEDEGEDDTEGNKKAGQAIPRSFLSDVAARLAHCKANGIPDATAAWTERMAEKYMDVLVGAQVMAKFKLYKHILEQMTKYPNGSPEGWTGEGADVIAELKGKSSPLVELYEEAGTYAISEAEAKLRAEDKAERLAGKAPGGAVVKAPAPELLPPTVAFDLTSAEALAQIQLLEDGFSVYPIRTDIKEVRKSLHQGIEAGESMGDLRVRVGRSFGMLQLTPEGGYKVIPSETYKAQRIARTESLRAANHGALEGMKQSKVVRGKQWINGPDPCEFCEPFQGQVADLNQNFLDLAESHEGSDGGVMEVSYADVPCPPLHPNCVCTIIAVTYSVAEAKKRGAPMFQGWTKTGSVDASYKQMEELFGLKPYQLDTTRTARAMYNTRGATYDLNRTLNQLGIEMERMRLNTEVGRKMLRDVRIRLVTGQDPGSHVGAAGWYNAFTEKLSIDIQAYKNMEAPLRFGHKLRPDGKLSPFRAEWVAEKSLGGTFRHEMGHRLHLNASPGLRADISSQMKTYINGNPKLKSGTGDVNMWRNFTNYGTTNYKEVWSEGFAMYTHPEYKLGTLPSKFEKLIERAITEGI